MLKRPPQTDQDYLHAYDTCAKYLDRLVPADAVSFLDNITFSADAAKQVNPDQICGLIPAILLYSMNYYIPGRN